MQKQYLLFMMAFSCVAQATISDEQSVPKDPYVNLRPDLRVRRQHPHHAPYANKMVEGAEVIDGVNIEKMKELEAERQEKRKKISSWTAWYYFWSSRPEMNSWFYAETPDTEVYQSDKVLNEKSDEDKKYYTDIANGYKGNANTLRMKISPMVKSNLETQYYSFETMSQALDKCKDDHTCYAQYYNNPDLTYEKIASAQCRKERKRKAFDEGLMVAHSHDIPVIREEFLTIMKENPEIVAFYNKIKEIDSSIDDLVNPERIKEREQKRIQELEEQRIQEEQDKQQALLTQVQQASPGYPSEGSGDGLSERSES